MQIIFIAMAVTFALVALLLYLRRKSSSKLYDKNFWRTFNESFFRQSAEQSAFYVDKYLDSKKRTQKTRAKDVQALVIPLFTAAVEDGVFSQKEEDSLMSFLNVYGMALQDMPFETSLTITKSCLMRDLSEGVVQLRIALPELPKLNLAKDEHPIWADMALVAEIIEPQQNVVSKNKKTKSPALKELDDTTLLLTSENLYIYPLFAEPFTIALKDIHKVTELGDQGIIIECGGAQNSSYMLEYFDADFWLFILKNAKNWSEKSSI